MATITDTSFDTVDDTITTVDPVKVGETLTLAISGTYNMTIDFQVEIGAIGSGAWQLVKRYTTADATVSDDFIIEKEARYRCYLVTDTSGTASITISDTDQVLHSAYDKQGGLIYEVTQAGIRFPGTMIADNVKAAEFQALDPGQKCTFFDDFLGSTLRAEWSTAGAGSGSNNAALTAAADGIGGKATIKSASDDGNHAANFTCLSFDELNYRADQGGLAIEAQFAVDDIANGAYIFVGFSDVIDTTSEGPLFFTADAIDSDAANACGVLYDFDSTTDEWAHGGVKANTDTSPGFSGSTPTDGTTVTVRVEVSAAGAVQGYIDGTAITGGAIADAVTITTPLTPYIAIGNRSANQVIMTLDYVYVQQDR
jgi:hypothetical protein